MTTDTMTTDTTTTPIAARLLQRCLVLSLAAVALSSCLSEPSLPLPAGSSSLAGANATRFRSVRVDAAQCLLQDGKIAACPDVTKAVAGGLKAAGLRGTNGAPVVAVDVDKSQLFVDGYHTLHDYWSRIPVGYGCECTLQGIFPNAAAAADAPASYKLDCLSNLLGAVRTADSVPLWTAAYNLGDGKGTCTFGNGEQQSTAITDPAKWAKVVRYIAKYYDRDLPGANAAQPICNPAPGGATRPWNCTASLFNIEFGRDPFGAGGFADTAAGRQQWLTAYASFAKELRAEFPVPGNDVNLIGPSIVLKGEASVADTTTKTRSPLFDFIDYVVAQKLPLSYLSIEVEAATPVEAHKIVLAVSTYAAAKGLKYEKDLHGADGKAPVPIWVTDLRLSKAPLAAIAADPARLSAYKGAFFAASKILWEGLVSEATVGYVMRTPTVDKSKAAAADVGKTAKESDLMWFGQADQVTLPNGSLKAAAWHAFWLNEGFLGAKQMLKVEHGLDPLNLTGKPNSDPNSGLILMATREQCVDSLGSAADCVPAPKPGDAPSFSAVTAGHQRMVRLLVADLAVATGASGKEILEHALRIQVDSLPKDIKIAGYHWASVCYKKGDSCSTEDTAVPTWDSFLFPDQGLVDVTGGTLHLTRTVPVPSLHYLELFY